MLCAADLAHGKGHALPCAADLAHGKRPAAGRAGGAEARARVRRGGPGMGVARQRVRARVRRGGPVVVVARRRPARGEGGGQLPCAIVQAHGKVSVCRVLLSMHMANTNQFKF